jgi:hypothetical protein
LAQKTIAKILDITKLNEKKTLSVNPIPRSPITERSQEETRKKAVEK